MKNNLPGRIYPFSLLNTILGFLVLTFCSVFSTVYFFLSYESQAILNVMSDKVISSKGETIKNAINYYIDIPRQANSIITHALQEDSDGVPPLLHVRSELLNVMESVFADNSYLSSVAFGSREGDYVGIARKNAMQLREYLTLKSPETEGALTFYHGTSESSGIEDAIRNYDMSVRPWYAQVYREKHPSWTQAYRDMNSASGVSISYSSPVWDSNSQFSGVVSSDLRLTELNKSLNGIKPFPGSILLIVNEKNQIISASDDHLTTGLTQGRLTDQSGLDLPLLTQSSSPAVAAVGEMLKQGTFPQGVTPVRVQDTRYFTLVLPLEDSSHLLKWKSIIIVPENVMMSEMTHYRRLAFLSLLGVFSVGLVLMLLVVSKVISPLRAIVRKTDELASYRWSLSTDKWHFPEIALLENAFWRLSGNLSRSFDALERQVNEDVATGLLTRAGLLKASALTEERNLLAAISVNNMSTITHSLGQEYGDAFTDDFVARMKKIFPVGTLLCRDAEDKFIALFPGTVQPGDTERYRQYVAALFTEAHDEGIQPSHGNFVFTGNAGLVQDTFTLDSLTRGIMNAYIALKYSRREGSGIVTFFSSTMHEQEVYNIQLHEGLRDAIRDEAFHLVMQPIVDLETGTCREGECLIRWQSETLGFVPPDRFISLAEETGLMLPLGNWIVEQSCRELAALIHRGAPEDFKLHMNISATQLLHADFAWHLLDSIKNNGLRNSNLCIEITETVLLQEISRVSDTLNYLRRHGVTVAIDDFGSGFSSLSYLHCLPFDTIKIDRNFVAGVLTDPKCESVIASVVVLAHGFNVPLIAEGIEEQAVSEHLLEMGCEKAQGYWFRRPVPFSEYHCHAGQLIYQQVAEVTSVPS